MSTYRTEHGVTIVREGRVYPRWVGSEPQEAEPDEDELIAVVVNGEEGMAERISGLLSGTTHEEWRVTGTWEGQNIDVSWSPKNADEPEADARSYVRARTYASRMSKSGVGWTDGPHLHKCTVTVTEWTEVEA